MAPHRSSQRGVAMLFVIIIIMMITTLTAWALRLTYNYQAASNQNSFKRMKAYYRAQAGIVDANWRIRTNYGGDFTDPAYDPPPYTLDIDSDGIDDATVNIDPDHSASNIPGPTHIIHSVGSDH